MTSLKVLPSLDHFLPVTAVVLLFGVHVLPKVEIVAGRNVSSWRRRIGAPRPRFGQLCLNPQEQLCRFSRERVVTLLPQHAGKMWRQLEGAVGRARAPCSNADLGGVVPNCFSFD